MTDGPGHRRGAEGSVSAAELLARHGQSPDTPHGPTQRGRRRRATMLAGGGVVGAVVIVGAVALIAPGQIDPQSSSTGSDPDEASESTDTANKDSQPFARHPFTLGPELQTSTSEPTSPAGTTPAPAPVVDSPQHAEPDEPAERDVAPGAGTPRTNEAPASPPPRDPPPPSEPPPDSDGLGRLFDPIFD